MFVYLIVVRPFNSLVNNVVNLYNEFILLFTFGSVLAFNIFSFDSNQLSICGWVILVFILLSLVLTWVLLIISVFNGILKGPKKEKAKKDTREASEKVKEVKSDTDLDLKVNKKATKIKENIELSSFARTYKKHVILPDAVSLELFNDHNMNSRRFHNEGIALK